MTQTVRETPAGPNSDPVSVRSAIPDPSGTRTPAPTRTPHHSDPTYSDSDPNHSDPNRPDPNYSDSDHSDSDRDYSDSDLGPSLNGPGPSPDDTRTRTTRTRTPATRTDGESITDGPSPDGPSLDTIRTRTRAIRTDAVAAASGLRAWFTDGYLNTLTVVVAVVASLGQKDFAETKAHFVHQIMIGSFDLSPWLAPVVFDVSVAALLHGGLRWAAKRHSPWPWWIAATAIAGLSVLTNFLHKGWMVTAPASGGLFVIWFLRLFFQYKELKRDREIVDSASDEFRSTDMLFDVDKRLASTAWLIARTKPLEAGLAYRHAQGDTMLTKRDLAILLARHSNTIYDDQIYRLTNPHLFSTPAAAAPAGSEKDNEARLDRQLGRPGKVHSWNRRRLADARRRAPMTAEDEVDRFLGLRVIERTGIVIAEVTYQKQPEPTTLFTKSTTRSVERPKTIAAGSTSGAPELSAAPRPRRKVIASVPDDVVDATEIFQFESPDGTVSTFEKPAGNAGIHWKPFNEIKGLEGLRIDPTIDCQCSQKGCPGGWKLIDHAMRRAKQLELVTAWSPTWATRNERITKPETDAAGVSGSSGQMAVLGVLNHLRILHQGDEGSPALGAPPEGETA